MFHMLILLEEKKNIKIIIRVLNMCVFMLDANLSPVMTSGQLTSSLRITVWSASSSTESEYSDISSVVL